MRSYFGAIGLGAVALLMAGAVAVAGMYFYVQNQQTFRFQMTVAIDTPDGEKSASSVILIQDAHRVGRDYPTGATGRVRGIAPIIDLGRYGTVIVTLGGDYTGKMHGHAQANGMHVVLMRSIPRRTYELEDDQYVSEARKFGKAPVDLDRLTLIVWLPEHSAQPMDARPLLHTEFEEQIAKGVRLKSITIEPTREPVVEKVSNAPRWLRELRILQPDPRRSKTMGTQGFLLRRASIETGIFD